MHIGAHCGFAPVGRTRTQVIAACRDQLGVIYRLELLDPLVFEGPLLVDDFLVGLELGKILNDPVDLTKDLHVILHASAVFLRKDMLDVVFKLLAANSADNVVGPRLGLLDAFRMLLFLGLLPLHVRNVVVIFLVQKLSVLLSKLSLFLQLENGGSVWRKDIEGR